MKALLPAFFAVVSTLSAAIVEKPLEYKAGEVLCEGWQAYDDALPNKRPGVLIIHQWTGVSDHEKEAARKLASLGYNVQMSFLSVIYCCLPIGNCFVPLVHKSICWVSNWCFPLASIFIK